VCCDRCIFSQIVSRNGIWEGRREGGREGESTEALELDDLLVVGAPHLRPPCELVLATHGGELGLEPQHFLACGGGFWESDGDRGGVVEGCVEFP